ncbi:MAG TPA: bifunctional rhamnulose-1-phosphate aldolase/short-chain dehydrogenase [Terriglobia bacterium]|jgi:rhamnose utilization protein RhaD (predicted bifunctional aldolase and dehydrogenase)/NAD(P)-dependent dehydrogenase (short-subunit alcohol dehydrogenase family)|nr:bifunctional rhamnulose-1-phosphate aldolase/short-chain dehydrogenase [Terriglobia bacterium]
MSASHSLVYLDDRWDESVAAGLDEPELLRYRSNLLGSDLRITNFGGGNTSGKITQSDPLDASPCSVLWVKGSGGDLGSIKTAGFATLYLDKLHALAGRYRGAAYEDEMAEMYPLCTFGPNPVAASIDTALHAFLPFAHVDHLHPDWGIALAAAANGRAKMDEFNRTFGHRLVWLPWQRPGFELAMMLRRAVEENPGCDGVVLGGHGLFTWGETARQSYRNTITIIDQLGQFVLGHVGRRALFGGDRYAARADRAALALELLPFVRGRICLRERRIGSYGGAAEVLRFVNSNDAEPLARLGTSCPDHFIRTKIRPLFVDWNPQSEDLGAFRTCFDQALETYRADYAHYYHSWAEANSPAMRDPNPTVVLVPGVGMFSFGKSKTESRITGEFYINAIHVMEGASALGDGETSGSHESVPQAGAAAPAAAFQVRSNYVALPESEAFRIEYWRLEEAKIRRQPPEKEFSRRVVLVVGGASGIGRETALAAAERGAHVVVADRNLADAAKVAAEAQAIAGAEAAAGVSIDIRLRDSIRKALNEVVARYGGLDVVVNTAALFPTPHEGHVTDAQWALTLELNVTGNHLLVDEASRILQAQNLDASVVLTSSANAVVPKRGSEAYDVSKAALSHLVREMAVRLAPLVRVNGISPATVIKGSAMFPRERVIASLEKYGIAFDRGAGDEELRTRLADFYAERTLTRQPIDPRDCARAILFLAGPQARCTTGHLFPIDGGLTEAFLR